MTAQCSQDRREFFSDSEVNTSDSSSEDQGQAHSLSLTSAVPTLAPPVGRVLKTGHSSPKPALEKEIKDPSPRPQPSTPVSPVWLPETQDKVIRTDYEDVRQKRVWVGGFVHNFFSVCDFHVFGSGCGSASPRRPTQAEARAFTSRPLSGPCRHLSLHP